MKMRIAVFAAGVALGVGWLYGAGRDGERWTPPPGQPPELQHATFAGGCFWCMEPPFDAVPGVYATTSGYAGGRVDRPSYEQVSAGSTGHAEVLQVAYDPRRVGYERLLEVFWRNVDPTDGGGQFCDRGSQYRPAIFFENEAQKAAALASKRRLQDSGRLARVAVEVVPLQAFHKAEEYHQDFYLKNPLRYRTYRAGCGRDRRLQQLWGKDAGHTGADAAGPSPAAGKGRAEVKEGQSEVKEGSWKKPSEEELKRRLTPLQYEVTQRQGTEAAFRNEHWDNHQPGIYVDVVSGEPLFSSLDKFDSGTGWPSFTRPLEPKNVVTRRDLSHGMVRVEVRSKQAGSHLGHLFDDGPRPTGQRYCLNSAALRFVPAARLEQEGYGGYQRLFAPAADKK